MGSLIDTLDGKIGLLTVFLHGIREGFDCYGLHVGYLNNGSFIYKSNKQRYTIAEIQLFN